MTANDSVDAARQVARLATIVLVAAVQFSIAVAQIALTVAVIAYAFILIVERRAPALPVWTSPLLLYAAWTLASAAASADPIESLRDCKQLMLQLIVPIVY